ncbi:MULTISPECIES: hypothetical protein [unclassified Nonomuraea]|uniref:hypothetical protein n=1 Tax=unclassified Nonomuraea TaxID=2593643 RepID=UPI0035C03D1D
MNDRNQAGRLLRAVLRGLGRALVACGRYQWVLPFPVTHQDEPHEAGTHQDGAPRSAGPDRGPGRGPGDGSDRGPDRALDRGPDQGPDQGPAGPPATPPGHPERLTPLTPPKAAERALRAELEEIFMTRGES